MSRYPRNEQNDDSHKLSSKEFLTHPAFLVMIAILGIGIWFGSHFINEASSPTPENSINYYGKADVISVSMLSSSAKCFVQIEREDGRVTKQSMPIDSCREFSEGDTINIENGQFISIERTRFENEAFPEAK